MNQFSELQEPDVERTIKDHREKARDRHLLVGGLYYALFVVAAVPAVVLGFT